MSTVVETSLTSLASFSDPRSVAVVGASDDHAKWGYWLARGALAGRERRDVWFVNRSAGAVQGRPAFGAVSALPSVPELTVLCVPSSQISSALDDALAAGSRAFLTITAGVDDTPTIRAKLADHGARMVGPNSLGLFDGSTDLQLAWGSFTAGSLAIISQSGQLGSEIANLAARAGIGVSRFVSVGNQLDVTAREFLDDLALHDDTRTVALYLESFADGEALVASMRRLRLAGKHVLVLSTGASEGSRRLAASHTGSMTSPQELIDAACRAAGAIRLRTPSELVETARYLSCAPLPAGRRIAIVSDSGGQGGVAADVCASLGLETPVLSEDTRESLSALLPAGASVGNPIDLAGAGEADLHAYAVVCEVLAASGEVDAIAMSGYLGCYGEDTPGLQPTELEVVDRLGRLVDDQHVPLVVHSMSADSVAVNRMWDHHIPTYPAIEQALRGLANARSLAAEPGRPMAGIERRALRPAPGYWEGRRVLQDIGVSVPDAVRVTQVDQARDAAATLAGPYALKAGWLAHKSEHGGVVLGLTTADELVAALTQMTERLGPGDYVVEQMDGSADVVEMIVGARRDPDFGPVVTVGAGGTEAELWHDATTELAPVDQATARRMVTSLRSHSLLDGWRGRPPVAIDELIDVVVSVSEAVAADRELDELEINPVRVSPESALAVDVLVTPAGTDVRTDR